jgi:general secretion pathway protein G
MNHSIARVIDALHAYRSQLADEPPGSAHGPSFARRVRRRGMSLLEVMVVIAIILTLMGVLAFGVMSVFGESQAQTTLLTMGKVDERIQIFMLRKKKPPTTGEGLAVVYKDGALPTDAWGNEIKYVSPGGNGAPFDLVSFGPDGNEGGGDDIVWSENK